MWTICRLDTSYDAKDEELLKLSVNILIKRIEATLLYMVDLTIFHFTFPISKSGQLVPMFVWQEALLCLDAVVFAPTTLQAQLSQNRFNGFAPTPQPSV